METPPLLLLFFLFLHLLCLYLQMDGLPWGFKSFDGDSARILERISRLFWAVVSQPTCRGGFRNKSEKKDTEAQRTGQHVKHESAGMERWYHEARTTRSFRDQYLVESLAESMDFESDIVEHRIIE
jgi:hypothetical protein